MLAVDTETCPIRRALLAPPLVCVSWARSEDEAGLVHHSDAEEFCAQLFIEPTVWHNGPFDWAVIGTRFPRLIPHIFDALASDLLFDTMMRQKLIDISLGNYRGFWRPHGVEKAQTIGYDLSQLHHRWHGVPLEKDEWRMRYANFLDTPVDEWPAGARQYAIDDARATLRVFQAQLGHEDAEAVFADQHRQLRAHWALHLMSCWGIRTDLDSVKKLDERLQREWEEARDYLLRVKLVRSNGSRDTKLAKRMMVAALGDQCKVTGTGEVVMAALRRHDRSLSEDEARKLVLAQGDYKYVSLDGESCELSKDESLMKYRAYGHIVKLRSTYVTALYRGVQYPIQSRFEPLIETGRTSSSDPNIQNPPREPGVRECFIPRPGCVFVGCDYDLAELRSLAEVCLVVVGHSALADALNRGFDPHLSMAAHIMGISYDEALARKKAGDPHIKEMRTLAKAANFGFPGGLGAKTFIAFARATYGVELTEDEAKALKAKWFDAWPEMRDYFSWINELFPTRKRHDDPEEEEESRKNHKAFVRQYKSDRCRGRVSYTQACNTFFQGLTADAAKEAAFEITRRQFCEPSSALYGTHIVNFLHDEFIIECREEIAHEVAMELRSIMVEVYNRWTPSVPMTAEPYIMRRWRKDAESVYNKQGRLIPWEDRKAA